MRARSSTAWIRQPAALPCAYHYDTKTSAPEDRNELYINWGDGTGDTLPRTEILPLPAPFDAQRNLYEGSHVYSGSGEFILSFEDQNRNEGVLNIPNSVNQTFCVKTMLKIGPLTGGNCSVRFFEQPFAGCLPVPTLGAQFGGLRSRRR
ncbi:MAG: hypothetical protein IPL77_00160 [Flavobacteriales bacterium]|nr:hypothetical protein [Flavobacteriales bacterium]